MPVLAEGIETAAQWQVFLANEGCAKGQGYLFAKPTGVERLPVAIEDMRGLRDNPQVDLPAARLASAS